MKLQIHLDFFQLLNDFISKHKSGKLLLKNGARMRKGSIANYENLCKILKEFCVFTGFELRVLKSKKNIHNQFRKEKNYWKKFYFQFTRYLYNTRNCHDNYTGTLIKLIRSFFNYLEREKGINLGKVQRSFYVRHENIPTIVLNPDQLHQLIYNQELETRLCNRLKKAKDIFVFGCTVGCRYSDLKQLTNLNLESIFKGTYLKLTSQKTGTFSRMKLPVYAVNILEKYKGKFSTLLPPLHLSNLIKYIREVAEVAGWTHPVEKVRQKQGRFKEIKSQKSGGYRFCDIISTHTMRKTAITTYLSLGMPEQMVRSISGHSPGSKEFFRYVNYAQAYLDLEADKVFKRLASSNKLLC